MRFRIGNGEHEEANNEEWRRLVAGVHPVRDVLLLLSGHSGLLHLRVDHAASAVDAFSLIWWEKGSLPEFGCTDSWIDWIWTRRGHNWHLGQGEFWNFGYLHLSVFFDVARDAVVAVCMQKTIWSDGGYGVFSWETKNTDWTPGMMSSSQEIWHITHLVHFEPQWLMRATPFWLDPKQYGLICEFESLN